MTFRTFVATAWFVVASFAACAHAAADTTAPAVIHGPIEYPASAVSAGEEGTVLVAAKVDVRGRAFGAAISRPSGYQIWTLQLCGASRDGRSRLRRRSVSR